MAKAGAKSVRYVFSVPKSDVQIPEWIENQYNLSTSIRILIKDYVARYGMTDASCLPIMTDDAAAARMIRAQPVETIEEKKEEKKEEKIVEKAVETVEKKPEEPVVTNDAKDGKAFDMIMDMMN